jgi:hypothetical protein
MVWIVFRTTRKELSVCISPSITEYRILLLFRSEPVRCSSLVFLIYNTVDVLSTNLFSFSQYTSLSPCFAFIPAPGSHGRLTLSV